jgi:hypothetical protein
MLTEVFHRDCRGISKLLTCLAASALLALSGCATSQKPTVPTLPPAVAVAKPRSASTPAPLVLPKPSPSPQPATTAPSPEMPGLTTIVAQILTPEFSVLSKTPGSIRASKIPLPDRPSPSLFEESILLGKIRAALKSSDATRFAATRVSFKNGIAEIAFQQDIPPETVASAIAKLLALDGVNQVHAFFPND